MRDMWDSTHTTEPGSAVEPGSLGVGVKLFDTLNLLRSVSAALLAQAELHGQLFQVEWAREKNRLLKMLGITLLGLACLMCALLFAGGLVLALVWDTVYRIPAVAGLLLIYAAATHLAWRRFQALAALGNQSFSATREELAADIALLRSPR